MKRIRVLLAFVFVFPIILTAQQTQAALSAANPITDAFRGFEFYGSYLMQAFDSIPAEKYGYKPTSVQQSVGYIAQHLENANYRLCETISGVKHPMTAKDSLADTVKATWPKDTLTARLKASLLYCQGVLARVSDSSLADSVVDPSGRKNVRVRFLLLFITDLAEHYNQIAGYMRINGMIPPSALPRKGGALNE